MALPDTSSPAAIFQKTLNRIEALLKKAKRPRAFKDDAVAFALRTELFKLEGWAKIHRHWPVKSEQKIFKAIHGHAKDLEDAFGALEVARVIAEDLRAKTRPDLADLFDERAKKERGHLKDLLKSDHWFVETDDEETRVEKTRAQLERIEWPSASSQFEYLVKAIVQDLIDVNGLYRSKWKPELLKTTYDRGTLDDALHEWRRQLRWFSMYFQTADGLFGLKPVPEVLTNEKKRVLTDYANNVFANLPVKRTVQALIDKIAFYELTKIIEDIGVVKDRTERYFHIRDLLIKQGQSDAAAAECVRVLYGDVPRDVPPPTQKILAEFDKYKPLAYIAESLS